MTAKTLPERLRNTPNWQRESFENWKTATCVYDRAPFEAADEIERLAIALDDLTQQLEDEKRQHEITRGVLAMTAAARDEAQAEAATAFDVCGPMTGTCKACGHEHELPNFAINRSASDER